MTSPSMRLVDWTAQPKWMVYYSDGDGPHRRFFETKRAASAFVSDLTSQRDAAGNAWLALSSADRGRLMEAWREASRSGFDLYDLVQEAKRGGRERSTAPTLREAIDALMATKQDRDKRYRANLEALLNRFAEGRELMRVDDITPKHLQDWLDAHPNSRTTWRARLSTLLSFCQRQGYTRRNPMDRVESSLSARKPDVAVLTPGEAKDALDSLLASPQGLAWFVLTTFAGLRPEEAMLTTWRQVHAKHIEVKAQTSKVRQRRVVYPKQMALDWLKRAKELGSPLPISMSTKKRIQAQLRKRLKWAVWPKDVTRHSAASYWLADTHDVNLVSRMLGNSPRVLERHYDGAVTHDAAAAFWALVP